ncbi:MAG: endonuclease/exonuclease/phosphatase family protein [Phycisphaerae bacterium]|nr:endonuclease/exonuclease/phosphatase family protein [Phycisphaerae bacterium]
MIAWNIARREEAWRCLLDDDYDIALLQEATEPPDDVAQRLYVDHAPWQTAGAGLTRRWRTAVVRLSDRVAVQWLEPKSVEEARSGDLAVSRLGTLAGAVVTPSQGEPFTVLSLYGAWEKPHRATGSSWIYADGSVHRLISDLSVLIGQQEGHRIVAAGDLNILYGYGENGSEYWASRYATVFSRMAALGLSFVGPQAPDGRRADPWPPELPTHSDNVPTFHARHQTPSTATRQLDFVFASNGTTERIRTTARNEPDQWGPSDHCRVEIVVT